VTLSGKAAYLLTFCERIDMAIVVCGKTTCPICGKAIEETDEVFMTPAFLTADHEFGRFSDAGIHGECFKRWEHTDTSGFVEPVSRGDALG